MSSLYNDTRQGRGSRKNFHTQIYNVDRFYLLFYQYNVKMHGIINALILTVIKTLNRKIEKLWLLCLRLSAYFLKNYDKYI